MYRDKTFTSFFLGGFECSTHRLRNGRRLDIIAATGHDRHAALDYERLRSIGISSARDGVRWHLIEQTPYRYDFSSLLPMVRAARDHGVNICWDLCHYGWPDDLDIFSSEFIDRFAAFARATAEVIQSEVNQVPYFVPMNEISFLAWGGGEVGYLNPFGRNRGSELKRQLIRAVVAAIESIRDVVPFARFVHVDPLVHVVPNENSTPSDLMAIEGYNRAVFDGWAMIAGQLHPELGGRPDYIDILGANYYVHNQWVDEGPVLHRSDVRYKPLAQLLSELHQRFQKPIFLAETGIEDHVRAEWLHYVCKEIRNAREAGVPVGGICLYPILNHPGWDDERHCHNGLWDYCNEFGCREVYKPLALELKQQRLRFEGGQEISSEETNMHSYNNSLSQTKMPDDLVCLSHLRWGFVFQRPQHLLSRFARHQRVFFVEEPNYCDGTPRMDVRQCTETGVFICVPQLPHGLGKPSQDTIQKLLLTNMLAEYGISDYLLWYYTPMALSFSSGLKPLFTIFDCMDELSLFKGAPQEMKDREAELLRRADLVFTGGQSLYEAKLGRHNDLHAFPSSIEFEHFSQARNIFTDPEDQAAIPHPRIGFCGVIDERMNLELIDQVAAARPDWHFVMIGPVVKIDWDSLPKHPNVHYLGGKGYKELPQYMAGWDVAMLPFAHNESTRFISPTKTPEYLAAGKPVVSTSITDVVRPYGQQKMVRIADTAQDWIAAIDGLMVHEANDPKWRANVDSFLAQNSWDITWMKMRRMIEDRIASRKFTESASMASSQLRSAVLGD